MMERRREKEKDEVDDDDDNDGGSSGGMERDKPNARGCGGGFFGFRESKKRGKNMGRPEEGKTIIWGVNGPQNSPGICYAERRARVLYLLV